MAGLAGMATSPFADGRFFALRLVHLHPDRASTPEDVRRTLVGLVTALEDHPARFALQLLATPDLEHPLLGRLEVSVLVVGPDDVAACDELADDLLDLLGVAPRRWTFRPITDAAELDAVLHPIDARHLAEIARLEEPCPPDGEVGGLGYQPSPRQPTNEGLWCTWTLGRPAPDLRNLTSVLLAQEAPVCLRMVLRPTALDEGERKAIEALVQTVRPQVSAVDLPGRAVQTLEALLPQRPLFTSRCVVASPEPLSRSLLSTIGFSISEPPAPERSGPILSGGYAILRGSAAEDDDLRATFDELDGPPLPSLAPAALRRVRSLMGPWEATNMFRLPTTDGRPFPGLELLEGPALTTADPRPARSGRLVGHLLEDTAVPVRIEAEAAFRHCYIVGQTGTGKSTLLLDLAMQDIQRGDGVAVLDPHGDLVDAVLERIPEERIDDVVLIDPADPLAVVGVNLLEADSPVQASYLVEELGNMFQSMFDPRNEGIVGPRFVSMLRQAALLLMGSDTPASMLDIATVFNDKAVRDHLIDAVHDPIQLEYWKGDFAAASTSSQWGDLIGWFRSKFEIFRTSSLVRNVVGQGRSTVSFTDVLDLRRILLVDISKGTLGDYNAALIGRIVLTRLWAAALGRAALPEETRMPFHVYVDEFQNMTSESLPTVLSEARKFRLSLTLANQFFTQIPDATRSAIMGNVGSRVTLRLGPLDAPSFATWLGPEVAAADLTRLPNFVAVAALSDDGVPMPPAAVRTAPPIPGRGSAWADEVRARSRQQWARPVEAIEAEFAGRWAHVTGSWAAQAAARQSPVPPSDDEEPSTSSSFLDDWLAKRSEQRRHQGAPDPDAEEEDSDE